MWYFGAGPLGENSRVGDVSELVDCAAHQNNPDTDIVDLMGLMAGMAEDVPDLTVGRAAFALAKFQSVHQA